MTRLVVCAPLRLEAWSVRRGLAGARTVRVGYGPRRAARAVLGDFDALAVAGVGGAVSPELRPGHVLVATQVRTTAGTWPTSSPEVLAAELADSGLAVRTGPLATTTHVVRGAERAALAQSGTLAVDMESAPLVGSAGDRPAAVVRVIVDAPGAPLLSPATLWRGASALRTLSRIGPALERWARETVRLTLPKEV